MICVLVNMPSLLSTGKIKHHQKKLQKSENRTPSPWCLILRVFYDFNLITFLCRFSGVFQLKGSF